MISRAGPRTIGLCAAVFVGWVLAQGSDLYLDVEMRGSHRVPQLVDEISIRAPWRVAQLGNQIDAILRHSTPEDNILDLTYSPLLHVITGRNGPGFIDVITPGVFLSEDEQRELIARLEANPPALVLMPEHDFDGMPSRSLRVTAPLVLRWAGEHYAAPAATPRQKIWLPRDTVGQNRK